MATSARKYDTSNLSHLKDLKLIAKASEPDEWMNTVEYIPFK